MWSLPLDARLKKQTESAIADLCNTPTNNAAISASAAWLLHHFCPADIPWAHLDVSGTALWREGGKSVASGRPIPLLMERAGGISDPSLSGGAFTPIAFSNPVTRPSIATPGISF